MKVEGMAEARQASSSVGSVRRQPRALGALTSAVVVIAGNCFRSLAGVIGK